MFKIDICKTKGEEIIKVSSEIVNELPEEEAEKEVLTLGSMRAESRCGCAFKPNTE